MISYTMPVYCSNQLVGVAGIDISFANLKKLILNTSVYDTGNAFLLADNYTFIVDKSVKENKDLNTMKNGKTIINKIKNNKSSVMEINFQGKKSLIAYYTLESGQIIGVRVPSSEVFKSLYNSIFIIVSIIIAWLVVSVIIAFYISRKISKPVEAATGYISKLARLDLSAEDKKYEAMISSKDEIGVMGNNLIALRKELIKVVENLKKDSSNMLQYSNSILGVAEDTSYSISQISMTIEELANGSVEQAKEAQDGSEKLNTFADMLGEVIININNLEQYSLEVNKMKERGSESVNVLGEKLEINARETIKVGNSIDELLSKSNQIEQIIDTISSIAEQTNLLALNASIEAARAGETGKGFAVVADEIRKLAEMSEKSTEEIRNIVNEIQQEITIGKNNMDNSKTATNEANNAMALSNDAFGGIGETINNTMKQIKNIASSVEKVDKYKSDIVEAIEGISSITEEAAASTEEVAATMENQKLKVDSVYKSVEQLKVLAAALDEVVEKFKLSEDVD